MVRPKPVIFAAAVSLVLASSLSVFGIGLLVLTALSLRTAQNILDASFGAYSSLSNGSIGTDLQGAVTGIAIICVVAVVLAIALTWGALSSTAGTSNATALAANGVTLVLVLIAALQIHGLLLLCVLLPLTAIIALQTPTSKEWIRTGSDRTRHPAAATP